MGHKDSPNHWKGFVLGVVGGAAGTLAMKYYWQGVISVTGSDPRTEQSNAGPQPLDDISLIGQHHKEGESSTAAIGRILDETVTGKEPKKETKTALSYIVHWVYGMLVGGIYGAFRGGHMGITGIADIPGGLAYGTGLWLFGSELAIPLLGLSEGPTTSTLASHAYGLGAHFAYGLTASTVTQVLYKLT